MRDSCWACSTCSASASSLAGIHKIIRCTAVVNVGDDAWMYGVRICPDLDTCMYTLGGGIDPDRGWGHRDETWHAKEELAAYGVQPDWFGLGDRDLATHLVRSQMLRAGYPLSQVTEALCKRWSPGARLLPASDDRSETHVVVTDPETGERKGDPLPGVVGALPRAGAHAQLRVRRRRQGHRRPRSRRRDRDRRRRAAGAVQPGGQHRRDPGHPRHPRRTAVDVGAGDRLLPHRRRKAVARHGRRMPLRDRRGQHVGSGRRLLRRRGRASASSTAGWCTRATTPRSRESTCGRCRC